MRKELEGRTDEELAVLGQEGDSEAMDLLLTKYKPLVLRQCRQRFLAGGDKEDLIQEGMIGLYKAVRDYSPDYETRFPTFAALCIDRQILRAIEASRREKNRPLNSSVLLTEEEWELSETLSEESPESIVIEKSAVEDKVALLRSKLSRMEKEVLDLYLAGHSIKEIAEILGKSPKSVDNAFQRVRRKTQTN